MRKTYLLFIIIVFPVLFMGCITPGLKETNLIGEVYRDSIQLKGRIVPLPEGEWRIVKEEPFLDQYYMIALFDEGKKSSLVITTESITNNLIGYLPHEDFDKKDALYTAVKNNNKGEAQDGWQINHYLLSKGFWGRPVFKEANEIPSVAREMAMEYNGMPKPEIIIQILHHFTGKYQKNKFLMVLHSFEPPQKLTRSISGWHPLRIGDNFQILEYINRLKKEGVIMHEKIRIGFGD